ncbi:MAG TPA: ATP-binding protein [Euzebyales bacterium]|nr:ATP-binding protein [Euzebyales bacterium]
MNLTGAVRAASDNRRAPHEAPPAPEGREHEPDRQAPQGRRSEADRPLRRSLQGKILSRALLISIVPLLLIASVTLGSLLGLSRSTDRSLDDSRDDLLRNVVGANARDEAVSVTRQTENMLAERIRNIMDWAASPTVYAAAANAGDDQGDELAANNSIDELESAFSNDRRLAPGSGAERYLRSIAELQPMFEEIFFTDRNGLVVASSTRTTDFVQDDEEWWARAWAHGLHISPVHRDESAEAHGFAVSVRITNPRTEDPVGVMRAFVGLSALQEMTTDVANNLTAEVTLLTRDEMLLAETASEHGRTRIMSQSLQFRDDDAKAYQAALVSTNPGYLLQEDSVAGYHSLVSTEGDLWTMLEDAGITREVLDWVAVVQDTNDDALAPLAGLDDVQEGVTSTGRTFVILGLLALVIAVIAAFVVSTRLANGIVRPLRALRRTAHDIAERQLPALIEQVQESESDEDLPTVPSVELDTDDEVEDVAEAFNVVRSTAVELAAEQARSRRNVSRMFVSLGRRNQGLLSRQLEFIDRLESEESNPELLDNLFRLDHLATRMRRNAESLLVLAGEQPSRRWSEPVSLTDVVRGAVAEVEDYQRVNLEGIDEAKLVGSAVGDVSHLLAELIENATHFSPPDSSVLVLGRRVTDGYALAIVDDGVGMTEEQLRAANERIEASPQIERVPSSYLGLFVVGRLAARHGIKVRLVESTTEGVTAKVLLPNTLVEPLPLEWPGEHSGEFPIGYDEQAVPVTIGGPHQDMHYAEPEQHTYHPPPQAPAPVRYDEPVPVSDDTADLPGLGVRRRSSKRGADGYADGPGREVARAPRPGEQPRPRGRGDGGGMRGDGGGMRGDGGGMRGDVAGMRGDARQRSNGRYEQMSAREDYAETGKLPRTEQRPTGEGQQPPYRSQPDAPRVFEVQRRASKRRDGEHGGPGEAPQDRTVLRMEPSAGGPPPEAPASPRPRQEQRASTDAERNAQAAKERLARFQRAVRQGRAQTGGPLSSAERNGGDRRDA